MSHHIRISDGNEAYVGQWRAKRLRMKVTLLGREWMVDLILGARKEDTGESHE